MDVPLWGRVLLYLVGSAAALVCLRFVLGSIRRLNRRIEAFEAELEARQGAPIDPYAALAEIYAEQTPPPTKKSAPKS